MNPIDQHALQSQIVLDNSVVCTLESEISWHVSEFAAVSLWFSFFAKCKTFNVAGIGSRKYLSSIATSIVAKQIYLQDVRTMSSIPKNVYSPVQW